MEDKKKKTSRKPYEKPSVIYRAALEAYAQLCEPAAGGKVDFVLCGNIKS
jgi:hypothetical protein